MTRDHNAEMWRIVFARAQNRASTSGAPGKFMNAFEDELTRLRRTGAKGEQEVLQRYALWDDPVRMAAEVEALSAYRAMMHWGTPWGMCPFRRTDKYQQVA